MSGPKSGSITVDDEGLLQATVGQLAESIQEEIRAVAERRRQKAIAEALERFDAERKRVRQAQEQRETLIKRFPGITLPPPPAPANPVSEEPEAIDEATQALKSSLNTYFQEVKSILMDFHRKQAEKAAVDEMIEWALRFDAPVVRTVDDLLAHVESGRQFAVDAQRAAIVEARARTAMRLLNQLPRVAGYEVSSGTVEALNRVLQAKDEASSQTALAAFNAALEWERQQIVAFRREQARREEERKRLADQEKNRRVAAVISHVLEDLGYQVTDVASTAFVQDGTIYAASNRYPNHLVKFRIDIASGRIQSEPLRVRNDPAPTLASERHHEKVEDKSFDERLCNEDLPRLRAKSRKRGLDIRFTAKHKPGKIVTEVNVEALPEETQALQRQQAVRKLRQRTRKT